MKQSNTNNANPVKICKVGQKTSSCTLNMANTGIGRVEMKVIDQ